MLDQNWIKKDVFDTCVRENRKPEFFDKELAELKYEPEKDKPLPDDVEFSLGEIKQMQGVNKVVSLMDLQYKNKLSFPLRAAEGLWSKIRNRRLRGVDPTLDSCKFLIDIIDSMSVTELMHEFSRPKLESRCAGKGTWVNYAEHNFDWLESEYEFLDYDGDVPAIYMPDGGRSEKENTKILEENWANRSMKHRKRSTNKKRIKGVDLLVRTKYLISPQEFKTINGVGGGQTEHYNDAFSVTKLTPRSGIKEMFVPLAVIDGSFWVDPYEDIKQYQTDGVVHPLYVFNLIQQLNEFAKQNI